MPKNNSNGVADLYKYCNVGDGTNNDGREILERLVQNKRLPDGSQSTGGKLCMNNLTDRGVLPSSSGYDINLIEANCSSSGGKWRNGVCYCPDGINSMTLDGKCQESCEEYCGTESRWRQSEAGTKEGCIADCRKKEKEQSGSIGGVLGSAIEVLGFGF